MSAICGPGWAVLAALAHSSQYLDKSIHPRALECFSAALFPAAAACLRQNALLSLERSSHAGGEAVAVSHAVDAAVLAGALQQEQNMGVHCDERLQGPTGSAWWNGPQHSQAWASTVRNTGDCVKLWRSRRSIVCGLA